MALVYRDCYITTKEYTINLEIYKGLNSRIVNCPRVKACVAETISTWRSRHFPSGNSPLSLGTYYCLTIAPRATTCSRFITHQQKLCVSSVLFTKKDKVLPNNLGCLN